MITYNAKNQKTITYFHFVLTHISMKVSVLGMQRQTLKYKYVGGERKNSRKHIY